MKKIATVIGARPQFIKASAVSRAIGDTDGLTEVLVHTGQHFDANMSDVFFEELGIDAPQYHLGISGGRHGAMTGAMLASIEDVIEQEKPNLVLVYGDTNSTLAAALAAIKLHVPVAHVEAGLRSFNMYMPEEVNRILTDRVSRWLFAPTLTAAENLRAEGVAEERIFITGDVMHDVTLQQTARARPLDQILGDLGADVDEYCLATIHRAENTDDEKRLATIVDAISGVSTRIPVILPLHPRTRACLEDTNQLDRLSQTVNLVAPLGYLDMLQLQRNAAVIVTDSGGVQKEAFFHRVPCVTVRDETEWVELISGGWNRLAPPTSSQALRDAIEDAIGSTGDDISPYGDGNAAGRIIACLLESSGDQL